jgi:hypothetical protein
LGLTKEKNRIWRLAATDSNFYLGTLAVSTLFFAAISIEEIGFAGWIKVEAESIQIGKPGGSCHQFPFK